MRLIFKVKTRDLPHIFLLGRVKRIWAEHGDSIIRALQDDSGIQFTRSVSARVQFCENPDWWEGSAGRTGKKAITISLPRNAFALYDEAVIWVLAHELGHRLLDQHGIEFDSNSFPDEDTWHYYQHKLLFIFLIDSLARALNPDQCRQLIDNIPGTGYTGSDGTSRAWKWANGLSVIERRKLVQEIIVDRQTNILLENNRQR